MGDGIIFSKGQKWKNNRSSMSAIFHFDSLNKRIPLIEDLTNKYLNKLKQSGNLSNVDLIETF